MARERGSGAFLARHATAGVALAFLLAGLASFGDQGLTWDGPESYRAGVRNLALIGAAARGEPLPRWPWHELPGYQFVADTLRAAFAAAANRLLWEPGSFRGFHLFNLLLATAAVGLTGRLAVRQGGAPVLGPLAALLLALQPKLIGHAVANPKDLPGVVCWLLTVLALTGAARRGRWRDFLLLGAALGLAGATHVTAAALLLPIAAAWILASGNGSPGRRLAGLSLAGVTALLVGLLCWPWLWAAPLRRALHLLAHLGDFDVAMKVLYLGRFHTPADLPWHYGLVSLAIATPLPWLLAAAVGLAVALRSQAEQRGPAQLARLAAAWLGLVLAGDALAPARYDGARHLLPALPALALLAAVGVWRILRWLGERAASSGYRGRLLARGGATALVVAPLALALSLAGVHPYADAWLDPVARAWLGPEAQRLVELEYWGATYAEGCAWLLRHAPADAVVLVPIAAHVAEPCLAGREVRQASSHPDAARPRYLMLMERRAWWGPRLRRLAATSEPVFTVRRQGSTLLAIYRLP